MDKYTLLIIFNVPFILFGYLKAYDLHKTGSIQRIGFFLRLVFWTVILAGLIFVKQIYNYLNSHNLTDSTPLSLADVILVTGVIFLLFLTMRAYSKLDIMEKRMTDLHEKIAIELSKTSSRKKSN